MRSESRARHRGIPLFTAIKVCLMATTYNLGLRHFYWKIQPATTGEVKRAAPVSAQVRPRQTVEGRSPGDISLHCARRRSGPHLGSTICVTRSGHVLQCGSSIRAVRTGRVPTKLPTVGQSRGFGLLVNYWVTEPGGMRERSKRAVLKTAVRETVPGVRIPLPPPSSLRSALSPGTTCENTRISGHFRLSRP